MKQKVAGYNNNNKINLTAVWYISFLWKRKKMNLCELEHSCVNENYCSNDTVNLVEM